MKKYLSLPVFWVWLYMSCVGQLPIANSSGGVGGYPAFHHYNASNSPMLRNQTWQMIQDTSQVLYLANGEGIYTYNGENWNFIKLDKGAYARSLARFRDTIFVGGQRDFGFLAVNRQGGQYYQSFTGNLSDSVRQNIGIVKNVACDDQGCYFQTDEMLYHRLGKEIKLIQPSAPIKFMSEFQGEVIVSLEKRGLFYVKNGKLVPAGTVLKESTVTAISAYGEDYFIATKEYGIHVVNKALTHQQKIRALQGIVDMIYDPNDMLLYVATRGTGLRVLSPDGELMAAYTDQNVLATNHLNHLFQDISGNIWCTSNDGFTRLNIREPYRTLRLDDNYSPRSFLTHHGKFYFTDSDGGLFSVRQDAERTKIEEISKEIQFGNLKVVNNEVWIGAADGVYIFREKLKKILEVKYALNFYESEDESYVLVLHKGLSLLHKHDDHYEVIQQIDHGEYFEYVAQSGGRLWLTTHSGRVSSMSLPEGKLNSSVTFDKLQFYGKEAGLPDEQLVQYTFLGQVVWRVKSNEHLYTYDEDKRIFLKHTDLGEIHLPLDGYTPLSSEQDGYAMVTLFNGGYFDVMVYRDQAPGVYDGIDQSNLWKYLYGADDYFQYATIQADHMVSLGPEGFMFYDFTHEKEANHRLPDLLVNAIQVGEDSVCYAGFGALPQLTFPYDFNTLAIDYNLPVYDRESPVFYQTKLEGMEDAWSKWSEESAVQFKHMREGNYKLHVRAKHKGEESEVLIVPIVIQPPFYRSIWAYLIYALLLIGLIYGFTQWRLQNLKKKRKELEAIIEQRTAKIEQQNKELMFQTEQLEDQAAELKQLDQFKANFFSNISHELRTPLTLINVILEKYARSDKKSLSKEQFAKDWKIATGNSARLGLLIDQLLDLSKLQTGGLEVKAVEGDVSKCLISIAQSYEAMAAQKGIEFSHTIVPDFVCEFDQEKLEKIVLNIVSNAIKAVDDVGGQVSMIAHEINHGLEIVIVDNGPGISEKDQAKIFERFYRMEDTPYDGSGIGLELTKGLVDLQGGTITVASKEGEGASFTVFMPYSKIVKPSNEEVNDPNEQDEEALTHHSLLSLVLPMVLIVEDHPELREVLTTGLGSAYRTKALENGYGIEEVVKAEKPDLIILDRMLPGQQGTEICQRLKAAKDSQEIPIIMLTAKTEVTDIVTGIAAGADDYVKKPFSMEELKARVANLIRQRSALKNKWSSDMGVKVHSYLSKDRAFIHEAIRVVNDHLDDDQFGVVELQEALNLSRMQLHRKLKELLNVSAGDFIRNIRLEHARQLLEGDSMSIAEVAYRVGFNDPSYFSKVFKKHYDKAPREV